VRKGTLIRPKGALSSHYLDWTETAVHFAQLKSASSPHTVIHRLADRPPRQADSVAILDLQEIDMSMLAVILSVWFFVATCAALFIRGASPRLQRATVSAERRRIRASVVE
jgi:hypothetical protein